MDRIRHSKGLKRCLLVAGILFAGLLIFAPFLHDHRPSLYIHENCPVYLFSLAGIAITAVAAVLASQFYHRTDLLLPDISRVVFQNHIYHTYISRAPPLV